MLHNVLEVQPEPVRTAALQRAKVGVGSHRCAARVPVCICCSLRVSGSLRSSACFLPLVQGVWMLARVISVCRQQGPLLCTLKMQAWLRCRFHASALVCALVRCACDEGHTGQSLQASIIASSLIPKVAHLAFSSPHCSCLHTAFLDAFSIHTLVHMPREIWAPLLLPNLGAPEVPGKASLEALPDLLFRLGELLRVSSRRVLNVRGTGSLRTWNAQSCRRLLSAVVRCAVLTTWRCGTHGMSLLPTRMRPNPLYDNLGMQQQLLPKQSMRALCRRQRSCRRCVQPAVH
jgi:hypothetical protein